MVLWVVEYIYADEDGDARISIDHIEAPDKQAALTKAANLSPFEEFTVSVFAESDDQFLGNVKHTALDMAGYGKYEIKENAED